MKTFARFPTNQMSSKNDYFLSILPLHSQGPKSANGNAWFSLLTKSWALAGESEPEQTKGSLGDSELSFCLDREWW